MRKPGATRRQYRIIYGGLCSWLAGQLGRVPTVADATGDALAAYLRHLERSGGRDGGGARPATLRVYGAMLRALCRELNGDQQALAVRPPRHRPGPPEAITERQWANLLRVPDLRTRAGRRDHAVLRVLGDLGLRGGELRALAGRHLRRPRSDSPRRRLLVPGKGGAERQLAMPRACQQAVESWLLVHPLARRGEIDPDAPLFVRLGRHERLSPGPLSAGAVHDLVRRCATEAGIPRRLAHPHQLRTFCATRLLEAGIPLHQVSQMLGHATLQTTARYAALRSGWDEELAEMTERLERR